MALQPLRTVSPLLIDISLATVGTTVGMCKTTVPSKIITGLKVSLEARYEWLLALHSMCRHAPKDLACDLCFGYLSVTIIQADKNNTSLCLLLADSSLE